MADKKQISSTGIAEQSGLDVFCSITTYNGEYLNWGDASAYVTQLASDTDYATTAANPHTDALINSPANDIGRWYRYHTSGSPYTSVSAPTSVGGFFIFNGQKAGGLPSYSGIYQKLSLIAGNEYQLEVETAISPSSGNIYVNIYKPNLGFYSQASTVRIDYPATNTSTNIITSTFTAETANDIIQIYFTTEDTSSVNVSIKSMSIKEKQEYLIPVYATDMFGNDHKVLRRNSDNIISND
jgi:hypothetical protein|tara:strand:+ start:892 stop:1611 length:720 start_codon:yes stop_codon:yes gene_type:complete